MTYPKPYSIYLRGTLNPSFHFLFHYPNIQLFYLLKEEGVHVDFSGVVDLRDFFAV